MWKEALFVNYVFIHEKDAHSHTHTYNAQHIQVRSSQKNMKKLLVMSFIFLQYLS